MQFSESWLRTFVNPALSSVELAQLLTMAGLEVEEQRAVAPLFDKVVVAEILSKEKHPDADRLHVLQVNAGLKEPFVVVCGAQNVRAGMKAPCALPGARLPGMEIRQTKVRGVDSFGMMCSEKELGLAEKSIGLMALPDDAPVGCDIREYLDLDDQLFTLKLTPNRGDCLSLRGIAREVAALTGTPLRLPAVPDFAISPLNSPNVTVTVPEACPRYTARVISGVNARAATPRWMVQRLQRCGLRSISALVDVTNYVLLEMGQPLHAFDLGKLRGGVTVRFARAGERIQLINEQTLELEPDMLVIADEAGPIALAGIMGGADSAVNETTNAIFLESAFFSPSVIAGKSRRVGFVSDSAYRFERGVDPLTTSEALDRATQLILEICGGTAGSVTEFSGPPPERVTLSLRPARIARVLGVELSGAEIAVILSRLGMEVRQQGESFLVTPPSYRFDIAIEEDLIEEVARVHGYENIPPQRPQGVMQLLPQTSMRRPLGVLRQSLVQLGYQETINYSFVDASWERDLAGNTSPIVLQNPIASRMAVMRSSLLGGLLSALQANLARKQPRLRLFEIGACFQAEQDGYSQEERLGGLAYGAAWPEQWAAAARPVDFFDVKGDLEALFHPLQPCFVAEPHPASHPGRSARILLQGKAVGWLGELHPQWQLKFDLPQSAIWFEIELTALLQQPLPKAGEISRFPPVRRDIAVVVDEAMPAARLQEALRAAQVPHVVELALFDLYRGKGLEQGKKSLAFRVLLQDTQKTLTDDEIDASMQCLIHVLHELGAQLRT